MKISQVVSQLLAIQAEQGDLDVMVYFSDDYTSSAAAVPVAALNLEPRYFGPSGDWVVVEGE